MFGHGNIVASDKLRMFHHSKPSCCRQEMTGASAMLASRVQCSRYIYVIITRLPVQQGKRKEEKDVLLFITLLLSLH